MTRQSFLNGILKFPDEINEADFREKMLAWIKQRGVDFESLSRESDKPNVSYKKAFHDIVMGNEGEGKRFSLRKVWEPSKKEVGAIMMNPSSATHLSTDETVKFLIEYLSQDKPDLNYGSLTVVNLSPVIKGSKAGDDAADFPEDDGRNSSFILEMIESAEIIILGWGEVGQLKGVPNLPPDVISSLSKARSKLRVFALKVVRKNSMDIWYAAHPKPQGGPNKRFKMDHGLKELAEEQWNLLFR